MEVHVDDATATEAHLPGLGERNDGLVLAALTDQGERRARDDTAGRERLDPGD